MLIFNILDLFHNFLIQIYMHDIWVHLIPIIDTGIIFRKQIISHRRTIYPLTHRSNITYQNLTSELSQCDRHLIFIS